MTCGSCGTRNDPGRKFCIECGTRLAAPCPSCGTPNPAEGKFCGECGAALAGVPASNGQPIPPMAERRLVSVLFADLVGFTTISEQRDAEDVRELLDRYFTLCRETIGRYGGTVEKFIGDAVMAVWGTPVAQEDDAERAVRAALDLVEAVRRLGEGAEVPGLALRAGVLTGEAAVTIGAADMGMVAGDLVNTASRLQSVAPPGTVLVGDSTRRASSNAIAYEAVGEQALKGKHLPVEAWRALRVIAQRGGVGRSEQLEAPFVGRSAELQLIKDFYHGTARERGVRLVSVIGQGGIGKSRLAWEFLKYIDGVTELVYWHQGRSPAYGEGITFWALGEMVRMRLGIGEGADEATTREKLAAALAEFVPDEAERRDIEGALLQLLGIGDGAATVTERGELFAAWRTFFERIAEHAPVVLVFEDLQWADEGLIDFIEDLLAWSRGRPIYIITLARPELLDRRPTWGAGQRGFTSLGLDPLTDAEMLELLAGLVPGLQEAAARTIVSRAEGIPLYAVETVRMLLNDQRLELGPDGYRPVGDLSELAVPESLHALIAARLDGLDPAERSLLQDAAVVGLSFGADVLAAVAGVPIEQVEERLRHLARREIVMLDDDPRSPERGNYRFVQGLIKEVAYGMLARRERRARHLAAARHFEATGDEELAGVLAQHYIEAYRAQPEGEEGAAVGAQARIALRGAASRARSLGSHARAMSYLETALEVTTDPADELELRRLAAFAAGDAGKLEAAALHLERAVTLAEQLGDAPGRRRAVAALADVLVEGHQERGLELLTEAMAEPGLSSGDAGYVELAEVLAKMLMRRGRQAEAVELAERALPAAEEQKLTELTIELLTTRGTCLTHLNRPVEAVASLSGVIELAERHGLSGSVLRAIVNLGYALEPDDPVASYRVSRDGMAKARRWGQVWALRYITANATASAVLVGDWDWALDQVREVDWGSEPIERLAMGSIEAIIEAARGADVSELVGEISRLVTQYDDGQFLSAAAEAVVAEMFASGRHADALAEVRRGYKFDFLGADGWPATGAEAAFRLGDVDALREMIDHARGARPGRRAATDWVAMQAMLASLEGRRADARALFLDALRRCRDLGMVWPCALIGIDAIIANVLEPAERQRIADETRDVLTRLGAAPYLAQLDAALAAAPAVAPRSVPAVEATAPLPE